MHTRFLFVRHATCAQTERMLLGRSVDAPLDARGRRQAHALAARMLRERPLRIHCSPRLRARQTACAIAMATDVVPEISPALDEIDFGNWEGRSFSELADDLQWQRWNADRESACTPAGESIAGVQKRVTRLLGALSCRFPNGTIVLVTHAEIVRSALLYALGAPADDYCHIDVAPASSTVMHASGGRLFTDAADLRMRA